MNTLDQDDVIEIDKENENGANESGGEVTPDTLRILEALLFASDELLSTARIKAILPGNPDARQIRKMVDKINVQLQKERHPFEIVEIGGGYQFRTVAFFHPWVRQIFKEKAAKKLSLQALECLAVIAYKQPVSKAEIEAVRGVVSDGAMKTLLEKKLVTISGRSDKPGRPLQYSTTNEFLRYFGLNKIEDLPRIEEFEAIAREKIEDLSFEELASGQIDDQNAVAEGDEEIDESSTSQTAEPNPPEPTAVFEIDLPADSSEDVSVDTDKSEGESEVNEEVQKPVADNTEDESSEEVESESEIIEPVDAEPVDAEPVEVEPVDAEPVEVEPVEVEPVEVEPVEVEPVEVEPVEVIEKTDDQSIDDTIVKNQLEEGETTEMPVSEKETLEALAEPNEEINPDAEEKTVETVDEVVESADVAAESKDSGSANAEEEEILEVFIPEKSVQESTEQQEQDTKKGFFSKIRKKK